MQTNNLPAGFPTYEGYPLIMGGDGEQAPQAAEGIEDAGFQFQGDEGTPAGTEGGETEEVIDTGGELGSDFLKGIEDPELKQALTPYVKEWDAGVTQRFQDLRGQLKPYQELGEVEQLQRAIEFYQVLENEPERVYAALAEALGEQGVAQQQSQTGQQNNVQGTGENEAPEDDFLPPHVQQKLTQMENLLTMMAENFLTEERQKQQAKEDEELDTYLSELRKEHGDFDEQFVIAQMLNGVEGPDAVKKFQQAIQQYAGGGEQQQQQRPAFQPLRSAGGAVPIENQDVTKMSSKDTKNLVADLIQKAAQQQ